MTMWASRSKRGAVILAASILAVAVSVPADARRGGSFGSRGSRTYSSPRSTQITPGYTPGLSRSMTAPSASIPSYGAQRYQPSFQSARPRFGFGSGLLAGVVTGGLLGSMFGHGGGGGYGGGGGGGMLAMLIQLAIIGGLAWFALRWFRRSRGGEATAPAMPFAQQSPNVGPQSFAPTSNFVAQGAMQGSDIAIEPADQQAFETLLGELQDAFGREDYARLRAITTPEIMSYLAEELSDNAVHGRRNEVSATRLIDAEVSEAWREGDVDYATIAMRYESIDVMRDRTSGAIVSGDASRPTEATEVWTFTRPSGPWAAWKVSAIQEA